MPPAMSGHASDAGRLRLGEFLFLAGHAERIEHGDRRTQRAGKRRGTLIPLSPDSARAPSARSRRAPSARSGWTRSARRAAVHRPPRRQHLVQDRADRIDIRAVVGRLAACLFGRVVVVKPAVVAVVSKPLCEASSNAGIFACPLAVMTTDSGLRPPCTKPCACASATASAIWIAISTARRTFIGRPADLRAQRLSLQELEGEVDAAVVLADIEERGDVGMRQRAQAARACR